MNFKKLKMLAVFADLYILPSISTVAREIVVSCGSAASSSTRLVLSYVTALLKNFDDQLVSKLLSTHQNLGILMLL